MTSRFLSTLIGIEASVKDGKCSMSGCLVGHIRNKKARPTQLDRPRFGEERCRLDQLSRSSAAASAASLVSSAAFRDHWATEMWHDDVLVAYNPLVLLIHNMCEAGPTEALFEGGGNWGVPGDPNRPPCDPHFNSCRLTERGHQVAMELLEKFPQYRDDVLTRTCN